MIETNSKTRTTLNELIEICKDGQEGFRSASENIDDSDLKRTLSEYSLQRSKFAGELQSAVMALGDKNPETSGSTGGALHRGWINLKTAIVGKERHSILAECEAGEDVAVKAYKVALALELPAQVRAVVNEQYAHVQAAHDKIKALRDAAKK